MTSIEAYKKFEIKVNGLDNSSNVDISPGEFIIIYNEQQLKWFSNKFIGVGSRYDIDEVQVFVETAKEIQPVTASETFSQYNLPPDYFDILRLTVSAQKGECKNKILRGRQVKQLELENYNRDAYNKPSFEYEATLFTLGANKLQVYKTDFILGSVFLTYYRFPKPIDIAGYKRVDGRASTNSNPELDDAQVDEIIDLCALEIKRTFQDPEGFQLSTDRVNKNN